MPVKDSTLRVPAVSVSRPVHLESEAIAAARNDEFGAARGIANAMFYALPFWLAGLWLVIAWLRG